MPSIDVKPAKAAAEIPTTSQCQSPGLASHTSIFGVFIAIAMLLLK